MSYFSTDELKCPCCGECLLMGGFLDKLNEIRQALGSAMVINSACRCMKHNLAVGGKGKSFHLINEQGVTGLAGCCAVDVSTFMWPNSKREKFLKLARDGGWSVGVANSFIHIDRRTDYPDSGWKRRAEWTYS
jgi:hypothetical protein